LFSGMKAKASTSEAGGKIANRQQRKEGKGKQAISAKNVMRVAAWWGENS